MILPSHKMCGNAALEYLTLSNPWVNTAVWLVVGAYCVDRAFSTRMPVLAGLEAMGLSLATWTLFEYLFHRFLMHHRHDFWHVHHHESPREKNRNMVPLAVSLPAGGGISIGLLFLLPLAYALVSFGAFALAFAAQDLVHYLIHNSSCRSLARPRALHMHHHFVNQKANFGVVTSFWDWFFGTRESRAEN